MMRKINEYVFFWTGFMSQWTMESFEEDGMEFANCEQYMMYHKALFFKDTEIANKIRLEVDPSKVKQLGRRVKNFDEGKWCTVREAIVYQGNLLRFTQNEASREKLMAYKDYILVEASPFDRIWGIGKNLSLNERPRMKVSALY